MAMTISFRRATRPFLRLQLLEKVYGGSTRAFLQEAGLPDDGCP
jgi:hypothetical protein